MHQGTGRWVPLLALYTFAGFVEVSFWGQMNAFTPLFLPHLGVPHGEVRTWTGVIVAVANAVGIPLLPFWGALADRYARQPIIIRSFVAHLLAGVAAIVAGNVWVFLLARALQSFSLGNSGLMMTTLAERVPAGRLGFAFAVMNGAQPLGAFLGPLLGGPVVDAWGFRALVAVDLVLLIVVVLSLSLGYRDRYISPVREPILSLALGSVGLIARSARLRTLFPALFLLFAGWMLAYTYLPLAVAALYHGRHLGTTVGIVLGVGGLATLILTPLTGALADRFGHWRVLVLATPVSIVLWPLPALTANLAAFTVLAGLVSGVVSGMFSLSYNVLSSSVGESVRGRVMSFSFLPANVGLTVGPAVGSVVTSGSVFAVFPTSAAFTALGLVVLLLAYRQPVLAPGAPSPVLR